MSERESLRERLSFRQVAVASWLGRVLPTRTGRTLFGAAGGLAYHVVPKVRAVVAANQARVLGRPVADPLVVASTKQAFRLYARYWFDAFHVLHWSDEQIHEAYVWDGFEHITEALEAGTGAIIVLPHMGNWDAAGRSMRERKLALVAVAEELRPRRLYDLFVAQREAVGAVIVSQSEDGVGRRLAGVLAENRVVALVADRDLGGRGIEVEMFGAPRRLPAGPALLSLTTGAPILTADLYQTPEGWRTVITPLDDVPRTGDRRIDAAAITAAIGRAFERAISAAPADWHLFQPGWED